MALTLFRFYLRLVLGLLRLGFGFALGLVWV